MLKLRQTKNSHDLAHSNKAAKVISQHPELLTYRNYSLFHEVNEIMGKYFKEDDDGLASWTFCLLDKIYRDPKAPRDIEFVNKLFSLMCNKGVRQKIGHVLSSTMPIGTIVDNLSKVHPFVLNAMLDANHSFSNLILQPTRFNNMNEELLSFVSAYAAEGYIRDPWKFMELSESLRDDEDARSLFIKFVKEKYASFDWYLRDVEAMINYINAGHYFTNVKDYYLWKNSESISCGYSPAAVATALADVYTNPSEAILKLANLK
jgi:hypothetical protein